MSKVMAEQQHTSHDGGRARSARVGGITAILAAALVVYGTYGDPQASDSQKSGMPAVLVAVVVTAAIVFGLLAPAAIRAVESGRTTGARWAVGLGIASVVSLAVFWSGLPLLLGGAAALVARAGRERTGGSRAFSWAWGLGLAAAGAAILVTIVGNALH
jgi:hypothetical protein